MIIKLVAVSNSMGIENGRWLASLRVAMNLKSKSEGVRSFQPRRARDRYDFTRRERKFPSLDQVARVPDSLLELQISRTFAGDRSKS